VVWSAPRQRLPGADDYQASHNAGQPIARGQPTASHSKTTGYEQPLACMRFETDDLTSCFGSDCQVVSTPSGKPGFAVSMRSLDLC
jgi:hypothetical protein